MIPQFELAVFTDPCAFRRIRGKTLFNAFFIQLIERQYKFAMLSQRSPERFVEGLERIEFPTPELFTD
ncbi:hypothetical protein D3C72_526730 [compost metagenome]